eukprot:6289010-Amphidinium_carterae.1
MQCALLPSQISNLCATYFWAWTSLAMAKAALKATPSATIHVMCDRLANLSCNAWTRVVPHAMRSPAAKTRGGKDFSGRFSLFFLPQFFSRPLIVLNCEVKPCMIIFRFWVLC